MVYEDNDILDNDYQSDALKFNAIVLTVQWVSSNMYSIGGVSYVKYNSSKGRRWIKGKIW